MSKKNSATLLVAVGGYIALFQGVALLALAMFVLNVPNVPEVAEVAELLEAKTRSIYAGSALLVCGALLAALSAKLSTPSSRGILRLAVVFVGVLVVVLVSYSPFGWLSSVSGVLAAVGGLLVNTRWEDMKIQQNSS